MVADGRKNQESFYFHNASQISLMVRDHSRHMETQICTARDVSNSLSLLPILSIAFLQFPTSPDI